MGPHRPQWSPTNWRGIENVTKQSLMPSTEIVGGVPPPPPTHGPSCMKPLPPLPSKTSIGAVHRTIKIFLTPPCLHLVFGSRLISKNPKQPQLSGIGKARKSY